MKRKFILLTLVVCLCFACVCGCSSNKTAAKVGDRTVTLKDIENAYQNYLAQYGSYLSVDTDESREAVVEHCVESVLNNEMEMYQAALAGITLTDAEIEQAKASAESDYESTFNSYLKYAESSGVADVRATANKYFTSMLTENGLSISAYKDKLFESEKNALISEKFRAMIAAEADVSDDAMRTAYDTELELEKANFDPSPEYFFKYLTYSYYGYYCHPIYIPAGLVRAKVIIVEDVALADELTRQINDGADFDELYDQYNEETMYKDVLFEDGCYLFCEGCMFDETLTNSILALKDGEITQTFMSDGCSVLAKRIGTTESYSYEYDEMVDTVGDYLISSLQSAYYSDKMQAWLADTSLVTKYESVYANVGK